MVRRTVVERREMDAPFFTLVPGRLTVLACHYPPHVICSSLQVTGVQVDLVRDFARVLGLEIDFIPHKPHKSSNWANEQAKACQVPVKTRDGKYESPVLGLGCANVDISIGNFGAYCIPAGGMSGAESSSPVVEEDIVCARVHSKQTSSTHSRASLVRNSDTLMMEEVAAVAAYFTAIISDTEARKVWGNSGVKPTVVCMSASKLATYRKYKLSQPTVISQFYRVMACRVMSCLTTRLSSFLVDAQHSGRLTDLIAKYRANGVRPSSSPFDFRVRDRGIESLADYGILLVTDGQLRVRGPTFLPVFDAKRKVGIDVEILRRFATALGCKLVLEYMDVEELKVNDGMGDVIAKPYQKLAQFPCDIVAGGLSYVSARDRAFSAWTAPYTTVRRSMILRAGDGLTDRTQVTGTVSVRGGSTADEDFANLGLEPQVVVDRDNTTAESEVFGRLLNGKVRGVLRGTVVAKAIVATFPKLFEYIEWGDAEPLHFMCNMATGIASALSAFCTHLIATGEMDTIILKCNPLMKSVIPSVKRLSNA